MLKLPPPRVSHVKAKRGAGDLGLILLLAGIVIGTLVAAAVAHACGVERWAVKTLSDPAAKQVNLHPQSSSVCALGQLQAPHISFSTPRQQAETQAYRINATIVKYKLESDQDIHLVLQDGGCSMIAESPDVTCTHGAQARWRMQVTRMKLETALGPAIDRWRYVNRAATLTGVLFFDVAHGQSGVAPNAVELHPLLGISVSQ